MKRRFEHADEGTYWEIGIQGIWVTTRAGALGTAGAEHDTVRGTTVEEVEADAERRIADKLAAGYREVAEPGAGAFDPAMLSRLVAERSTAPLPEIADTTADELTAWRSLVDHADLSEWAERMVFANPCDPAKTSFAHLAKTMTMDIYGCALVCGTFSNVEFLCGWDNDDERTYLVSQLPASGGRHPVYWFAAHHVELDRHHWSSITSFVWRDREDAGEHVPVEPAYLDPVALSRRSRWLTCALAGVGFGSIEEDAEHVADVARFAEEAAVLGEHPHLACYWLLHHAIAGNADLLSTALERTRDAAHPWVVELRKLVERPALDLGAVDADYIAQFRSGAPRRAFAG